MSLKFESGGLLCAASIFRPADTTGLAPCVVMGHGFTGTRDQLVPYAEAFAKAGLAVLTFDYRHFGESEGSPRQIVAIKKQMEDWRSAIALARTLEGVDPKRIALWGSSLSGGHVINLGAEDSTLAAIVAQVPAIDKSTHGMSEEAKSKMKREGVSLGSLIAVSLRSLAAAVKDAVRGLVGLSPYYMPVFGRPGTVAAFTDPAWEEHLAFFTKTGPTWRNEFAPRFLFGAPKYVKGTAERLQMPLLVCVAEQDTEANPTLAIDIARKAPHGVLKTYTARHFEAYGGAVFQQMLSDQTVFLRRHLSVAAAEGRGGSVQLNDGRSHLPVFESMVTIYGASKLQPVKADVRVHVARSPEVVFAYVVDLRNEPEYNGQVAEIIKTSPDPIGKDTTFTGLHRGFGEVTWRLAEYDPPRHVKIEGAVGRGLYRWVSEFERTKSGTLLIGHMEWEPPRRWRFLRPILGPLLAWNARRSFRRMAAAVERRVPPNGA